MKILLVRHGQTIENAAGIVQGQLPGNLSEKGKEQAIIVANELQHERFDRAICSDLKRCVDTAEQIMKFHPGLPVEYRKELREMHFGEYQGKKSAEVDWNSLPGDILNRRAPNAESGQEMRERVIDFVNLLLRNYPDETILLVTHGGPMRNIKSCIENTPALAILKGEIDNCSVLRYDITRPLNA
jgi:broad specificity phosphatase PhoE